MTAERLVLWPLLLMVLLSPLPLASVVPWAWGLMGAVTAVLLLVWAGATMWRGARLPVPFDRVWIPAALFGGVAVWVLIQMSPWTPDAWHHPLWQDAGAMLHTAVVGRIAVDPHEAGSALLRLLTYGGVFWLSLQCCRNRDTARQVMLSVAAAGFVYAVYGLVVQFSGAQTILWYQKIHYVGDLTSTFVNRNSYAAYAGIGLISISALITQQMVRLYGSSSSPRQRLRIFLRAITERDWVMFVAWVVVATALLLSHSRGGFAASCLGVGVFLVAILLSPSFPGRLSTSIAVVLVGFGVVFVWISGGDLLSRVTSTSIESERVRVELNTLSLDAISDAPLIGTGYGSYEQIYHMYRGPSEAFRIRSARAHNTYLENALELGIPAAAALTLAVGYLAWICLAGARNRRRDGIYPAAAFGATVLVGTHSLIDFSLQIPAISVTYCLLLGLGCAQSWRSGDLTDSGGR